MKYLFLAVTIFSYFVSTHKGLAQEFACGVHIQEGAMGKAKCSNTTGNEALNAKAVAFSHHLQGAFNLHTKVCFIEDNPPNAWSRNDGKIFLGRNLIRTEFEQFGNVALLGVMAHEWAHQAQFKKWKGTTKGGILAELQADCVAGYHLGRFGKASEEEILAFGKSLFAKGDYAFSSSTHHGTPDARLQIMMFGFGKAKEEKTTAREIFGVCLSKAQSDKDKDVTSETLKSIR